MGSGSSFLNFIMEFIYIFWHCKQDAFSKDICGSPTQISSEHHISARIRLEHEAKWMLLNLAKVAWPGASNPSRRNMKLISLLQFNSMEREDNHHSCKNKGQFWEVFSALLILFFRGPAVFCIKKGTGTNCLVRQPRTFRFICQLFLTKKSKVCNYYILYSLGHLI